jgi:hypothetical protein
LKFCREHRVPFGKKGNLDNHQIDYVGDYAHALHNGRYPDGALTDGEEFTLNIKKKYQAVYTQLTLGAKMTSVGNLAYFFKKKNQEKLHIKCIMKPDADKYILLKTKSTKKKGNIQNRWIHLKPTQEKKFLDFCRRYNVASEDDWLQNTLSLSDIPLREDKDESTNRQSMLFTHKQVWSHGHQCYVAENEVNSKATGSYIFTIRHANAPEKLFLNTDICQEALHEFGTKQEEQQTEQERRKGLGKLAGKVTGLGRGLYKLTGEVDDMGTRVGKVEKVAYDNEGAILKVNKKVDECALDEQYTLGTDEVKLKSETLTVKGVEIGDTYYGKIDVYKTMVKPRPKPVTFPANLPNPFRLSCSVCCSSCLVPNSCNAS